MEIFNWFANAHVVSGKGELGDAAACLRNLLEISRTEKDAALVERVRQETVETMKKTGNYGRMVQYSSVLKASPPELLEAARNYVRNLRDIYLANPDFKNAIIALDAYGKDPDFPASKQAERAYNSITRIVSLEHEIAKRRETPFYKRNRLEKRVNPVKNERKDESAKLKAIWSVSPRR